MPGSVANASATVVMPGDLAERFVRIHQREVAANVYMDGRSQASTRTTAVRRVWQVEYSLPPADAAAMRSFWETNRHKAMIFYDWEERMEEGLTPLYDETGSATGAGKYEVRFDGDEWAQENNLQKVGFGLRLVEIT